jgi:hypothetical protein
MKTLDPFRGFSSRHASFRSSGSDLHCFLPVLPTWRVYYGSLLRMLRLAGPSVVENADRVAEYVSDQPRGRSW